ncbi:MAG: adenylate/guanylate cyclase domain-containing protein [Burkholderiales bacterium]
MMPERANRTFICSVLFLDIVEYSKRPVSEQIQLKDRFNALIAEAIRDIVPDDRIILDTGDGVAVNFLGDPEDALFVAMSLREAFAPDADAPPSLPARIGINLGPVRLVRDLNGQPNIIGDGINVAQRVMGFATPGQVLVSRSYFEVVSHISDGNSTLFHHEGSRTDKHVREHEIYSVGHSSIKNGILRSPAERARESSRDGKRQSASATVASGSGSFTLSLLKKRVSSGSAGLLRKLESWTSNRTIAYGTAALSVFAFVLAVTLNFFGQGEPLANMPQSEAPPAPRTTMDDRPIAGFPRPRETAKSPKEVAPDRRVSVLASHKASASAEGSAGIPLVGSGTPDTNKAGEEVPFPAFAGQDEQAESAAAPSASLGLITLAISPWGEVFVDGKRVGVSPPVNEVEVAPGARRVEIKNGKFPAFAQTVDVKVDQKVRIKHKFN